MLPTFVLLLFRGEGQTDEICLPDLWPFSGAAALLFVQFVLVGFVEAKRWADLKNPGSQGDGSFFGVTDELKGQSNGSAPLPSCRITLLYTGQMPCCPPFWLHPATAFPAPSTTAECR